MKFISNTNDIRHHLGIKNESYPASITNITFDSRKVKKSSFFICLKGENSDGNEFIDEALKKGASLILSNRKKLAENNKKIIYTPNTIKALRKISESIINSFSNNRIGVRNAPAFLSEDVFIRQNSKSGIGYFSYWHVFTILLYSTN